MKNNRCHLVVKYLQQIVLAVAVVVEQCEYEQRTRTQKLEQMEEQQTLVEIGKAGKAVAVAMVAA